jgi:cytochrome c oxidase cbb3-type subunit 3
MDINDLRSIVTVLASSSSSASWPGPIAAGAGGGSRRPPTCPLPKMTTGLPAAAHSRKSIMSDFVSGFWSVYVALITLVSLSAASSSGAEQDKATNAGAGARPRPRLGRDLEEYNNPLPRWWSWLFYITVVFALGYLAVYPGPGQLQGRLRVEFAWASTRGDAAGRGEVRADLRQVPGSRTSRRWRPIRRRAMGERLFLTYCAQCHGSAARGAKGFPNLPTATGCGAASRNRSRPILEGRQGVMPPFGPTRRGDDQGPGPLRSLALAGQAGPRRGARRARQGGLRQAGCAGCHGPDAKGMQALGAPNLTDSVWLYGSSEATVIETIAKGRSNKMPATRNSSARPRATCWRPTCSGCRRRRENK